LHYGLLVRSKTFLTLGALTGSALIIRERQARQALERLGGAAMETLLNAIEANDHETGMHVRRVAAYALIIADAAGLDEHQKHAVERVALFHDIGKIHEALLDIVREPTRLTAAEKREIDTHPARGAGVLDPLKAFYPELPAGVLAHHERWDGTGYPKGLRGRRIPLESRIVAIADTFDAVSHNRRYRRGGGFDAGLEVIAEGRGTQFDPELVDLTLFPPVAARLKRSHVRPQPKAQRRSGERESVPDISFRWRSESFATARVHSAHSVD
jgi:HD-GYP domain-containing protein (c-di-GMP phosphodiesterase class II)